MARLAREENEALKARIAMLEAKADKPQEVQGFRRGLVIGGPGS